MKRRHAQSGQSTTEFALLYAAAILPLTFMIVFVAEMLWIWHSAVDFTREGARYAATSCWAPDGSASNVLAHMQIVEPNVMKQFQSAGAQIQVAYFTLNPDGSVAPFDASACTGSLCIPDSVSVGVENYQFLPFSGFMKLPPVTMPPFTTTVPMESAGYQDDSGVCVSPS
ncbi:MAG TPA: TadE family protein [Bryobacteraceae bacterium]|nr:TadE family protein [Bryobacteraceae bacterium]